MIDRDQLQEVAESFGFQFVANQPVGTIPGEVEFPVQIVGVGYTPVSPAALREFRCPPDESAILVWWMPAKWERLSSLTHLLLVKLNIRLPGLPPKQQWIKFPKQFHGLPVHYKRGGRVALHGTKR